MSSWPKFKSDSLSQTSLVKEIIFYAKIKYREKY